MRQRGASIFIYLIFGILIAVFVINFAPNQGGQSGCSTSSSSVVEVDGESANLSAYRVAYSNQFNRLRSRDKVYFALETLVRREILAEAAAERGLRVTGDMVDEEIKKGYFFLGGLRIPLGANIFDEHEDNTRTWNVRKFKSWVASLDVKSTSTYRDEQVRSMQAALMYEVLSASTRVSREEALANFLHTNNTVSYDLVTFAVAPYRAALRVTDADIERYLAAHEADVKARYERDERLYKGLKPQLKLRQIFVAAAPGAADVPPAPGTGSAVGSAAGSGAGSAAGSGAGSAVAKTEPAKPGVSIEEAKKKLEDARTAIAGGKQKLADAAKQLATDDTSKANGGDLGWRSLDNPQLGDKALNDAVKALKPGELTPVITTSSGAYLVLAEDKREGDLSYDKVKLEIAAELAQDVYAREAAKRAALAAIEEARTGSGKNLSQMFEKEPDDGGEMPNLDFLSDPNMSPEQQRQMMEQLKKQMQQRKQGSITIESKDIPVKWSAPDETKGNGSSTGAGSGSAAATGSATATGSAAGGGSATVTPPTTPPSTPGVASAIPPVEPSKDQLPQLGTVAKPKIASFGPVPRTSVLPGLSKELTPVVFDELSAGMLAKRVYEVNGDYVLLQVSNKAQAKVEDFEKEADRYVSRLQMARSFFAVEEWIEQRCKALHKEKKIVPMQDLVNETDEKTGKPA
ncbi:MAG TPA: peptidylprolyl isomerase, partial [Kofleriaceae bacterium]|nr:peptidylprolyl isomerase [Kofleriaceae bacterium]